MTARTTTNRSPLTYSFCGGSTPGGVAGAGGRRTEPTAYICPDCVRLATRIVQGSATR